MNFPLYFLRRYLEEYPDAEWLTLKEDLDSISFMIRDKDGGCLLRSRVAWTMGADPDYKLRRKQESERLRDEDDDR